MDETTTDGYCINTGVDGGEKWCTSIDGGEEWCTWCADCEYDADEGTCVVVVTVVTRLETGCEER